MSTRSIASPKQGMGKLNKSTQNHDDTIDSLAQLKPAPLSDVREVPVIDFAKRAPDIAEFCQLMLDVTGFDISPYRDDYFIPIAIERFKSRIKRKPLENQEDLKQLLLELAQIPLVDKSEPFRDPIVWLGIENQLSNMLPKDPKEPFKVWSCGCRYGEETLSIASLIGDMLGTENFSVLGTDIFPDALRIIPDHKGENRESLEAGFKGIFRMTHGREINSEAIGAAFANTSYELHNAVLEPPPGKFDLILCRYVAMHLNREGKAKLVKNLASALNPNGLLVANTIEDVYFLTALDPIIDNPANLELYEDAQVQFRYDFYKFKSARM